MKTFIHPLLITGLTVLSATNVYAQTIPKAMERISAATLKEDLTTLASDHFRGREAGTIDELNAATWLAEKARAAGLQPAGDNGTYFQFFSLLRKQQNPESSLQISNRPLTLWKDVIVFEPVNKNLQAPVVYIKDINTATGMDLKGKVIAIPFSPTGIRHPRLHVSRRYPGIVIRERMKQLLPLQPAAVIFIADSIAEENWNSGAITAMRGTYNMEGGLFDYKVAPGIPVLWVRKAWQQVLEQSGQQLAAQLIASEFTYPSVNVIARTNGTDPVLRKEYVLYSGHIDHDGIRPVQPGQDSVFNGADDNGTVDVALLAIGRAMQQQPPKRSVLYVFHGSEERGLYGSTWYAAHPTVPPPSIVAVLNADMIGRNHPDSAALLGIKPPHRNSIQLVETALAANNQGPRFKLDTLWDNVDHMETWYFRSDHLPYAKAGYPAVFFSTLLHPDYHTPKDEADRIDYEKLRRVTQWMYLTGWKIANAPDKPAVEAGFKLER